MFVAAAARADDIAIHAFVDGYYAWNGNHPASHENFLPGTGTTAERANEFNLNLAAVELVHDAKPVGFHLSLVAGTGADVVHAAEREGCRHVYQASVIYRANDRLTFEGGIFPSHIGFEAFFSKDNWNYTRGWLGEFSPYYQTGIHAGYQFSKQWYGELHVLNGWQLINDNNNGKSIGAKIAYSGNRLSASLNTLDGPELPNDDKHWRHFGDLIATWKLSPKLSLGGSVDRGHQQFANWLGAGGYGRYAIDDRHAVAFRAERFRDPDNGISGFAQKLTEGTLTYEYRPAPNLILKLEGRRDHSTANVFDGSKSQTLVVAGAVATF
ncbi:MAG TPA: porin [Thermoanaerobaculia bacterium]|nr:porin [Thermoanaerobaculia bacterium]